MIQWLQSLVQTTELKFLPSTCILHTFQDWESRTECTWSEPHSEPNHEGGWRTARYHQQQWQELSNLKNLHKSVTDVALSRNGEILPKIPITLYQMTSSMRNVQSASSHVSPNQKEQLQAVRDQDFLHPIHQPKPTKQIHENHRKVHPSEASQSRDIEHPLRKASALSGGHYLHNINSNPINDWILTDGRSPDRS